MNNQRLLHPPVSDAPEELSVRPTPTTPPTARDAWETQYQLVWGEHLDELPETAVLSFTASSAHQAWRVLGTAPVHSSDACWNVMRAAVERGDSVYVGVGVRNPGTTSQGKSTDVLCHTALVADLDINTGTHASANLPTLGEALRWVAGLPQEPTLVIHSGGGLHVWQGLSSPIDVKDGGSGEALYSGWADYWKECASTAGLKVDEGPLSNSALVLRVAGSRNHKYDNSTVQILTSSGHLLDLAEASTAFPIRERTNPPVKLLTTPGLTHKTPEGANDTRPGTLFAREVTPESLLVALYGGVQEGGTLRFPRGDNPGNPNTHIYVEPDGTHKVVFYGETMARMFDANGHQKFNSFDILAHRLQVEKSQAAKYVMKFRRPDGTYAPLIESLTSPETPQSGIPGAAAEVGAMENVRQHDTDLTNRPVPATVRAAIETKTTLAVFLEGGVVVRLGANPEILLRSSRPGEDGKKVEYLQHLTAWVPWMTGTHEVYEVRVDGRVQSTQESEFFLEILTAGGRRHTLADPLNEATVYDLKKLRSRFHRAAITLPIPAAHRAHIENVISTLGAADQSRDARIAYSAMGWALVDGNWTYLAPAGSVTAAGIRDLVVARPGARDGEGLPPAMAKVGFDRIPAGDELHEAAASIAAFKAIMPNSDAPWIALGALWSAVLPQDKHTTLAIRGTTGGGKSGVMGALQAFQSGAGPAAGEFTASLITRPSAIGLEARAAWSRFALATWDDHRMSGTDAVADAQAAARVETLIQLGIGAETGAKSNVGRGIAQSRDMSFTGVLTCEELPRGGAGIVNRLVAVQLEPGDVELTPRGTSAFDLFIQDFADSGKARALHAAYLRWLAERMDNADGNGLRSLHREVEKEKKAWHPERATRADVSGSTIAVGWRMFRIFARLHEIEDLLPPEKEVDAAIVSVVNANAGLAADEDPALRILLDIRDRLGSRGYISGDSFRVPGNHQYRLGWEAQREGYSHGNKLHLGTITPDFKNVIISRNAVKEVAKSLGITTAPAALSKMFEKHAHPDSFTGKPSARWGLPSRPRGFIVSSDVIVNLLTESADAQQTEPDVSA
ncbi:hypothetical protein [Cryobacterium lyxosi]|uniref:DUF927 domain-containing protein n=1 Tax=Cryobacterium lyxosi TaxID=1259228 RepID=A0A4R8ZI00_9MICO|nr:hypothetical protein [Cryobacterium lyxosi]TFD26626.1 hypothetical protein E3T27_07595 [Cryobacterium lyxosi]